MLEDNEDDVHLIRRVLLQSGLVFESVCVDTQEEFYEAIHTFVPDIVLSDHGLPQFNSREALKVCLAKRNSLPFILVTGTMTDEFAISILHDGADDYVLKSNLSRLPSAIRRAIKHSALERLKRESRHELRKQNNELVKVNHQIYKFVYSISHNLRGPLASMSGLLNIAKELNVTKDTQVTEVHDMMDLSIHQLNDTINEIIEYSKNARTEITVTEIDWMDCVRSSIEKLTDLEGKHIVSKKIEIHGCADFYSDAPRIETLFTNLLSNSLIYQSKDRIPAISISVRCDSNEAVITLKDNGIGISQEVLPHIFNMFYRGTTESHGAGLGLFIVKETVTKLNGTINIMSCAGLSTMVTITIPNITSEAHHPVLSEAV